MAIDHNLAPKKRRVTRADILSGLGLAAVLLPAGAAEAKTNPQHPGGKPQAAHVKAKKHGRKHRHNATQAYPHRRTLAPDLSRIDWAKALAESAKSAPEKALFDKSVEKRCYMNVVAQIHPPVSEEQGATKTIANPVEYMVGNDHYTAYEGTDNKLHFQKINPFDTNSFNPFLREGAADPAVTACNDIGSPQGPAGEFLGSFKGPEGQTYAATYISPYGDRNGRGLAPLTAIPGADGQIAGFEMRQPVVD